VIHKNKTTFYGKNKLVERVAHIGHFKRFPGSRISNSAGVKKQTIDSYLRENGYMPSAEAAVKIARALNVSVE